MAHSNPEIKAKWSDEEIISEYLLTQDRALFDRLYHRYIHKVYAKCIALLQDSQMAEDAAQEVFIKVLMNLYKFKGNARFSTWLYSITYNYCIDHIRKQKKYRFISNDGAIEDDVQEEVSDKEILEIKFERMDAVLKKAKAKDRAILMMKYIDDMSIKQIATALDKSESATKMNILRAKNRIKSLYKEMYHE